MVPTAWSPDGRLLAGPIVRSPSAAIGVYDVASRTTRRVPGAGCEVNRFIWLQDSRRVLCVNQTDDVLWLVDVESGRLRSVASGLKLSGGVTASPDRRTLYSTVGRQQADIWMVETKVVKR